MIEHIAPNERGPRVRRFRLLEETTENWDSLGLYGWFEQAIALILTALTGAVIIIAVIDLIWAVARDLYLKGLEPVDHTVFQSIFGMIMTVLIAMEFNHTILSILHRKRSIVQLRTVILIALLALARKFIIIDLAETAPMTIAALAFAALSLGCVYWLVRQQDSREDAEAESPHAS
jgi:uncharacterized membrane protein (DUF373 family)